MVTKISRNEAVTTSTSSVQVAPARFNRVAIYLTNMDTLPITIFKGDTPAILNSGIILQPTCSWFEVDNGEGFRCWRGAIQVIGSQAGSVAISEDMVIQ